MCVYCAPERRSNEQILYKSVSVGHKPSSLLYQVAQASPLLSEVEADIETLTVMKFPAEELHRIYKTAPVSRTQKRLGTEQNGFCFPYNSVNTNSCQASEITFLTAKHTKWPQGFKTWLSLPASALSQESDGASQWFMGNPILCPGLIKNISITRSDEIFWPKKHHFFFINGYDF